MTKTARKPLKEIDPSKLRIAHDPVVARSSRTPGKYDEIFKRLTYSQCIVCEPGQSNSLANALRDYFRRREIKARVKSTDNYSDGKGRVWMLHVERAKA